MDLVIKNNGDVQKIRHEEDVAAKAEKTEADVTYIAMIEGIELSEGEAEEDEQ